MRARRVSVWVCAMIALGGVSGAPVFLPVAVFAASGTVSVETPLYASADPAAPVITLLPEGTIVSIDGPPVAGFYPVTAGDDSGWIQGETVQVEKDLAASDAAEEMAVDAPLDETDGTVQVDATAELDPALSTTVEPAADPAVPASAATDASAPVPVDASAPASAPAIAGDIDALPTAGDGAVSVEASAIPVAEVAPVGPASVAVDAPILAGPWTRLRVDRHSPGGKYGRANWPCDQRLRHRAVRRGDRLASLGAPRGTRRPCRRTT